MLDWNLEEAPYFVELTQYPAGNLAQWAQAQGGLAAIPLATRLDLVARIADAVAAVHGVGVLHKDLKASNILMRVEGAEPQPLLADFGGAGVLADEVIANAGITRMGFTQMLEASAQGTTLYVAPEVLEGQPQTQRGDVYALGVLLYQMVVGDFRKPVSPGWEQGVADELVQHDIADAVQGDPARRLSSAGLLAERIRSLPDRRAALLAERETETRRHRAEQSLIALRQRRRWLFGVIGGLALGLAFAAAQYYRADRQRERAEAAAQLALDSGRFMIESLLPGFDGGVQSGTRDLSVRELLDAASKAADAKLGQQPELAFYVRLALGNAYNQVVDGTQEARRQELLAHAALRQVLLNDPSRAARIVPPEGLWITGPDDRELVVALLAAAESLPGFEPRARLGLLGSVSDAEFRYGSLQTARKRAAEAEALAESLGDAANVEDNLAFRIRLAREDADFAEAERLTPAYARVVAGREPRSPLSDAFFQADRGVTRLMQGRAAEAATDLDAGARAVRELQPDSNWYSRYVIAHQIGLAAALGRDAERQALTREWLSIQARTSPKEPDMPGEALVVAEGAWQAGDIRTAETILRELAGFDQPGRRRDIANRARLALAQIRADAGDAAGAREWQSRIVDAHWQDYRQGHPREALLLELEARLLELDGRPAEAAKPRARAKALLVAVYPPDYWRITRLSAPSPQDKRPA